MQTTSTQKIIQQVITNIKKERNYTCDGSAFYSNEAERLEMEHFYEMCACAGVGDWNNPMSATKAFYPLLCQGYNIDEIIPPKISKVPIGLCIDYKKGVLLTPRAGVVSHLTKAELKATKGKKSLWGKALLITKLQLDYLRHPEIYYEL